MWSPHPIQCLSVERELVADLDREGDRLEQARQARARRVADAGGVGEGDVVRIALAIATAIQWAAGPRTR